MPWLRFTPFFSPNVSCMYTSPTVHTYNLPTHYLSSLGWNTAALKHTLTITRRAVALCLHPPFSLSKCIQNIAYTCIHPVSMLDLLFVGGWSRSARSLALLWLTFIFLYGSLLVFFVEYFIYRIHYWPVHVIAFRRQQGSKNICTCGSELLRQTLISRPN